MRSVTLSAAMAGFIQTSKEVMDSNANHSCLITSPLVDSVTSRLKMESLRSLDRRASAGDVTMLSPATRQSFDRFIPLRRGSNPESAFLKLTGVTSPGWKAEVASPSQQSDVSERILCFSPTAQTSRSRTGEWVSISFIPKFLVCT